MTEGEKRSERGGGRGKQEKERSFMHISSFLMKRARSSRKKKGEEEKEVVLWAAVL